MLTGPGEKQISPCYKDFRKSRSFCSSHVCGLALSQGTPCGCPIALSPHRQQSPSQAEGNTCLHVCLSLFPSGSISCTFYPPHQHGADTYNVLYCQKKSPSKTSNTAIFLPKGKCGYRLAKKHATATERVLRGRIVKSSESHSRLLPGHEVFSNNYIDTVLGLLKSVSLPWQKQNELIKCLPLAYFGNFMECVKA